MNAMRSAVTLSVVMMVIAQTSYAAPAKIDNYATSVVDPTSGSTVYDSKYSNGSEISTSIVTNGVTSLGTPWSAKSESYSVATNGVLKFSGYAEAMGPVSASAQAKINLYDNWTISNSALSGRAGIIHASLIVHGADSTLTSAPNSSAGQAITGVSISAGRYNELTNVLSCVANSASNTSCGWLEAASKPDSEGSGYGTYYFDIPFTFGSQIGFSLLLRGSAEAKASAGESSLSRFDWANTVYWGGISGITYQGSNVAYSLSSDSGIDWSQSALPVPEPEMLSMLVAGLGFLLTLKKRKMI